MKKGSAFERERARSGVIFLLPWFIGLILFFLIPLIKAFIFAFQKLEMSANGMVGTYIGLENFRYAFLTDTDFLRQLLGSVTNLVQVPLILVYSLFFAILIKDKFPGRSFMRAIAFLPVIIGSGVLMQIIREDVFAKGMRGGETVFLFSAGGLNAILLELGMGDTVINFINTVVNQIFDLTWKSGVQIMLFLSGLHGVTGDVYEASSIEGARKWEQFWRITFPLLSPTILLCVVYSVIDSFMDFGNTLVRNLYDTAFMQVRYGYSSAMSILYFILVTAVLGIVYVVIRKRINYEDD